VATMRCAETPSDAICYHKHALSCLPDVLHVMPLVTNITQVHKGRLAILLSYLRVYPSNILISIFSEHLWPRKSNCLPFCNWCHFAQYVLANYGMWQNFHLSFYSATIKHS